MLRHLPAQRLQVFAGLIADSQRAGAITPGVEPRLVFLSILGLTLLPLATSSLWRRIWQDDPQIHAIDHEAIAAHAVAMLTGGLFSPHAAGPQSAAAAPPAPATRRRRASRPEMCIRDRAWLALPPWSRSPTATPRSSIAAARCYAPVSYTHLSAPALTFPGTVSAPPITTTRPIDIIAAASRSKASARLESGPI